MEYFVHRRAQDNGDHEVHASTCSFLPSIQERIYLGDFIECALAVREARKHFKQVNGCYYCVPCHTG
ncbi:MAG: hypothetical protein QOI20_2838 [Acidimicrobiaceae bacterium]|jgi:hypothetical protein|nr:hypothetical protein [Acidimicrobiaceae bacterium]